MSLPFERLTIHALRGIRDLELAQLGQFNLLVGENDSGKTTVLEALSLYCDPLDTQDWIWTAGRREPQALVVGGRIPRVDRLRWLFPQRSDRSSEDPYVGFIRLAAEGGTSIRELQARYQELRELMPERPLSSRRSGVFEEEQGAEVERRGAEVQIELEGGSPTQTRPWWHAFTLWENESVVMRGRPAGRPRVPVETISPQDHRMTAPHIRRFSEARLSGFQESVQQLLHALDSRITGIEILAPQGRPVLYLRDRIAGLSPLSTFGDGIRRALLIALTLPRVSGGVLLIDELETAIHVSALGNVFRWMLQACKQFKVQLFVTTHSLEALDAILEADTTPEEDIVGFRLERAGDRTVAKRYNEGLLKLLRHERGLDVR